MDFDPTLLRAFLAVKKTGGFTRAAQQLHLTQSAVSHQIRRLEEQVGRPLLYRTTRRLTLTEDGNDFAQHAEQILASLDALASRFRPSPVSGVVRFGVPETYMGEQLPPLLSRFARGFPDVRLDVTVSSYLDLRKMIDAGELDLAVVLSHVAPWALRGIPYSAPRRTTGASWDFLHCVSVTPRSSQPGNGSSETVLRPTQFVWVAAEHFELPPEASLPLAFAPVPCVDRQVGIQALESTSIKWHIAFTSLSQEGIRAAVLAGLGVTVQMCGDVKQGMKVIDSRYGLPSLPKADFTLIWSAGNQTPATRELGQLLMSMPRLSCRSSARRCGC